MLAIDALSPEKRAQILEGAAQIFAEDGYEGASMSRIAAIANVSKGTLYNHFESKAQLFSAYIEAACARNLCQVFAASDESLDVAAALARIGRRMVEMMLSDLGLTIYRVVVAEARKFPELARAFYNAGPARAIDEMARWLAARAEEGTLAVADPSFAAEQFFCLCQTRLWLRYKLNLQDASAETSIDEVVSASVSMFLNTYGVTS
jgi:AcrR family transcriptional regulator